MNAPEKTQTLEKISILLGHDKAQALAESLKKDDPTWDYQVVKDNDLFSHIDVYDEAGLLVGKL